MAADSFEAVVLHAGAGRRGSTSREMARPTHPPGPVYDDPSLPGNVHQLGLPPRRIDVLTEISGVDLEGAWSRRSRVEIAGACVPVLDRENLLADERASVRPKDPADLAVPEAGSEAE